MSDKLWARTPARWQAQFRAGFLSGGWWTVNMNGHTDTGQYNRQADAEREAARLNYVNGSYHHPGLFGMNGVA